MAINLKHNIYEQLTIIVGQCYDVQPIVKPLVNRGVLTAAERELIENKTYARDKTSVSQFFNIFNTSDI
jgi:hypothetical protein